MEEEINLMDYVKVLIKRWKFILGLTLIPAILAFLITAFQPQIREISTTLEIGRIGPGTDAKMVENPGITVNKIQGDVYGVIIRTKLGIPEKEFPKFSIGNPTNTDLINIEFESSETEQAKNILKELNNLIIADHIKITGIEKDYTIQERERLKTKIASLEKEKENIEKKLEVLEKLSPYENTTIQLSYLDIKGRAEQKTSEIENFKAQLASLEKTLEYFDLQPTQVIKEPYVSEEIVGPRRAFNAAIALVLGCFVGVLGAFGMEWWEKNKLTK